MQPRKRGRPRKDETMNEPTSLNPQHEARLAESKAYQEKIEEKKEPEKIWYERVGNKIVRKSKVNGSVYSNYIGLYKECKHLLKENEND